METTVAILLRRTRFSETSLIITWLTEGHGKLKTMAKGALRPKTPFSGALDLFFETEIAFVRSNRSELHTLREVSLRDARDGIRRDYGRVELAAYFVELVEMTTEPEQPVPEIYHLLRRALAYLEGNFPSRKAMLHFENQLAQHLGVHADGSAADALFQHTHRLPDSRRKLMDQFKEKV